MAGSPESAARRYADAVFDLAQSENRFDEWETELETLSSIFAGADVLAWLTNPGVSMADKESVIDTGLAFAGQEARNLGRLLVTSGRVELSRQILDIYRERLDEARGIVHALVTTAVPLSDSESAAISQRLIAMTGQQVKIDAVVDPSIIGGIVVRMGDRLIDGSARARLQELKRRLAGVAR
jgi:F-type H+-transporting ATPase subunit delta